MRQQVQVYSNTMNHHPHINPQPLTQPNFRCSSSSSSHRGNNIRSSYSFNASLNLQWAPKLNKNVFSIKLKHQNITRATLETSEPYPTDQQSTQHWQSHLPSPRQFSDGGAEKTHSSQRTMMKRHKTKDARAASHHVEPQPMLGVR